jgi:hypothetical protein
VGELCVFGEGLGGRTGVEVQDGGNVAASTSGSTSGGEVGAGAAEGTQAAAVSVTRATRLSVRGDLYKPTPFVPGRKST